MTFPFLANAKKDSKSGTTLLFAIDPFRIKQFATADFPRSIFQQPEETALIPRMASSPLLLDQNHQAVSIAVESKIHHLLEMTGRLPFEPKLLARTGIEMGLFGFQGFQECLRIHVSHHQDLFGLGILNDGW